MFTLNKFMNAQNILFIFLSSYLVAIVILFIFSIRVLVVTSDSMKPTFNFGDVLLAKGQEHYSVQDVVSFKTDSLITTHRIVGVKKNNNVKFFQTKGDANSSADKTILTKDYILGKVFAVIPYVGFLVLVIQSRYTILILIALSILFMSRITVLKIRKAYK